MDLVHKVVANRFFVRQNKPRQHHLIYCQTHNRPFIGAISPIYVIESERVTIFPKHNIHNDSKQIRVGGDLF